MAYNEEGNIDRLLKALLNQRLEQVSIEEIIVVASGCTDNTEAIVLQFGKPVKLIVQKERQGKASAINLFLKLAKAEVLVLISGDVLPEGDALEHLVSPFINPGVGMTGAYIIPENSSQSIVGFYVQLFWRLHHEIGLRSFKGGEMIAFRNVVSEIPFNTATDETWIAALVLKQGYQLQYVPGAVVHNKGPENIIDFLKVRRRHLIGYLHLKKVWPQAYLPETLNNLLVLKLLLKITSWRLKPLVFTIGAVFLEIWARCLAWYDFCLCHRNPYQWEIAKSTKRLIML